MTFKTLLRHMKREINEDILKQCSDIKIDCHDIKNCRRKKFCRYKRWKIVKISHDLVCHNKDFDVATNNSKSETFKA